MVGTDVSLQRAPCRQLISTQITCVGISLQVDGLYVAACVTSRAGHLVAQKALEDAALAIPGLGHAGRQEGLDLGLRNAN